MDTIITYIKTNFISFLSLIISFICYIEYRKLNKITLKIDKRTTPKFDLEMNDSSYIKKDSSVIYIFSVLITNLSDTGNSIKKIKLNINYEEEGKRSEILLSPKLNEENILGIESSAIPLYIEGRNSKNIFVQFTVPIELKNKKKFLEYSIVVSDSFEKIIKTSTSVINEVSNIE